MLRVEITKIKNSTSCFVTGCFEPSIRVIKCSSTNFPLCQKHQEAFIEQSQKFHLPFSMGSRIRSESRCMPTYLNWGMNV